MKALRNTKTHSNYWKNRKISWEEHYGNWQHPHRQLIVGFLRQIPWMSLVELGAGAGANLIAIIKGVPGSHQLGGIDISEDAIKELKDKIPNAITRVGSIDDIMLSDKSSDIIISDMALIYFSPRDVMKCLKEIKRVARNYVILCELNSTSWWNRMAVKYNTGYYVYDYRKLLTRLGFCDIVEFKLRPQDWPESTLQQNFASIFIAKILPVI